MPSHIREFVRWVATSARRLQLNFCQRPRWPLGSVSGSEGRQPEVGELGPESLCLFLFQLQEGIFLSFANQAFHLGSVELELAFLTTACVAISRPRGTPHRSDLPESVAKGVAEPDVGRELADLVDNPSWVFSKSFRTRSCAASMARFFSSSASVFNAASLAFCFLMSRL